MPNGANVTNRANVTVITASFAATAFIAGSNAKAMAAMVTVAVVIKCVPAASVLVFTHIMAVTRRNGDTEILLYLSVHLWHRKRKTWNPIVISTP